jgi:hypothetical protein
MRLFDFDPASYSALFAAHGYVHIRQGLSAEYYRVLAAQVAEQGRRTMPHFARGDKQQALYEFPAGCAGCEQLRRMAGAVCGLEPREIVVSERHVKAYEADADPLPQPHKDRYATQVALGFAVHVPAGSTLVLYPHDDLGQNPFNSWAEMRAGLPAEQLPPGRLAGGRRVEIHDAPRDVVLFRGSATWHSRERAAGTVMVYFKLNAWNCDPIGEDPQTPQVRDRTRALLALPDEELADLVPLLGRKVDTLQRRFTRDRREVLGVALYEDRFLVVDAEEWRLLEQVDGRRSAGATLRAAGLGAESWRRVRRLAACGILDLALPAAPTSRVSPSMGSAILNLPSPTAP